MTRIEIVATGPEFTQRGIRGFESVMEEIISSAESEILVISYVITSSALHVLELMEKALHRGVKITIVINNINELDPDVRNRLFSIERKFPRTFNLINFRDFADRDIHAKAVIADRKKAVIGSANLSWGGIRANYEIGVLIEGEPVWHIVKVIDNLLRELQVKRQRV